ncbi:unnamed protein product, partial [Rotaria sp. Silwood2]
MDNAYNRYYIKIRTILGINPKTIHEELATALGPKAPSYPTVADWAKRFREGREDVNDDPRSGRPVSELTDENIELVRQVINNDPHSTYDDIIVETSLSRGTIEEIIHNYLKMKKVTSRWIPHQLNDEQKQEREMRRGFTIGRFITSQQTKPGLAKVNHHVLSPVLIHCVDKGKTIDHNYYTENCLKPVVKEIREQRKSNGTKGIKLLHDNASPHRHQDVINYLTEEDINIMPHPSYSPDLVPCDYWLNDYIKQNLTDQPNEKSLAHA